MLAAWQLVLLVDANHVVECFGLCLVLDLEQHSQFVIAASRTIENRLHINAFSAKALQELLHLDFFLALIELRGRLVAFIVLRLEEVNLEFEWTFLFLVNRRAEEAWIILVVQAIVRLGVDLVFVELVVIRLLLTIIVPAIIIVASITVVAIAAISVAIVSIAVKGLSAPIATIFAIVVIATIVVAASLAPIAIVIPIVLDAVALTISLVRCAKEAAVRPFVELLRIAAKARGWILL